MGSFKEGRGGWQKKITKCNVGRGVAAKKVIPLTYKKGDFASDMFFEWSLQCWIILLYFLWVYLMMMLEANVAL